jgi:hypothetical protein
LRRGGATPAFEHQEALIQVPNQLIKPPLESAPAELQLLDSSGQLPQLLLDPREAHLKPGEPPLIVGLDQLHRARGIDLAVHTVEARGKPCDRRVSLACGEPQQTGTCRDQIAVLS